VGNLGFGSLAAHGHADALSVIVDVDGIPVLRDSGTGSYASSEGRDEFRVTAAHNTVLVDDESQAQPLGPHLWGRRFMCVVEETHLSEQLDYVRASHDGYVHRRSGARHTRSVLYLRPDLLVVLDRITAERRCAATLCWNLPPGTMPERLPGDARLVVASFPDATQAIVSGRYSTRYGSQLEAARITWTARSKSVLFATVLQLGRAGAGVPTLELHLDGMRLTLTLADPQRVRIVERWAGPPTLIRHA
jgi:heparinase II/III-like protein